MLPWPAAATRVAARANRGRDERSGRAGAGRATRPLAGGGGRVRGCGWRGRPRRRARPTTVRSPASPLTIYANDTGQLQVAFNGSATGEFFPPVAGAGQRRVQRRGQPGATTPPAAHGLRLPGHAVHAGHVGARRSSRRRQRRQPVDPRHELPRRTGGEPAHPRRRAHHLRQRHHGRQRLATRWSNPSDNAGHRARALTRRPTSTSPATTPASASSIPGRRARSAASTRRPEARARLVEQTPWYALPGGPLQRRLLRRSRNSDRSAHGLQRHDRPHARRQRRRACNGTSPACRPARQPDLLGHLALQALHAAPARRLGRRDARRARSRRSTVTARNGDGNPDPGRSVLYAIAGAEPGRGRGDDGRRRHGGDHVDRRQRRHRHPHGVHRHQRQRRARRRRARADRHGDVDGRRRPPPCRASRWSSKVVSGRCS